MNGDHDTLREALNNLTAEQPLDLGAEEAVKPTRSLVAGVMAAWPTTPYSRAEALTALPEKFQDLLKPYGEPDVNGDAELEAVRANNTANVMQFVAGATGALKHPLEQHIQRERLLANLFHELAKARMAVIRAINPPTPVSPAVRQRLEPAPAPILERMRSYGFNPVRWAGGIIIGLRKEETVPSLYCAITSEGYGLRYDYATRHEAKLAFDFWDGTGVPPGDWSHVMDSAGAVISQRKSSDAVHERPKAGSGRKGA